MNNRDKEDLRQRIGPIKTGNFVPPTTHVEQWTVDPFWELDQPTLVQSNTQDRPGPSTSSSSRSYNPPLPMEEGEINSETDQDPSVLKVPAIDWARHVGVKGVQYVKKGHAPQKAAKEQSDWNLEQAVRETEKNFPTDLQLILTETTNDANMLKTLVCLERQHHELIPGEYQTFRGESCQAHLASSSWKAEL